MPTRTEDGLWPSVIGMVNDRIDDPTGPKDTVPAPTDTTTDPPAAAGATQGSAPAGSTQTIPGGLYYDSDGNAYTDGPADATTDPSVPDPDAPDPGPAGNDFVPADLSGEADAIQGDGNMDYTVPEAGDTEVPLDSGTADPTMTSWDVTDEQTVAGQLTELYDRDSPFFEQARQRAIRSHLSSGGQNSAMAGAAGELAAMDTAFKVGFADAQTYARSAEFNAAMSNQFSLAEQRFIHNALLSEQNFQQAKVLQTQRIGAQMEAIVLDYKGRNQLLDKQLDQFFLKAAQTHQYQLDMLYESTDMQMSLNTQMQMSNFMIASFQSVMESANNPNFTPEQSSAAMREGMAWMAQQGEFLRDFLYQYQGFGEAGGDVNALDFLSSGGAYDYANGWGYYPPTTSGGNSGGPRQYASR